MAGNLTWSLATARYDAAGVAAVSGGRARPWSGLAAPAPDHPEGAESCRAPRR
jgi:hypothetical protein